MNTKAEILAHARFLMEKHGLVNWTVKFVNSHSFAGMCIPSFEHSDPSRSRGRIELSWNFFEVFSTYDKIDTILHEIAHALTPSPKQKLSNGRTRYSHHGPEWKAKAKEIGCSGGRCVRPEAARPKSKYTGICPNGHESRRQRLTWNAKHATSCGKCQPKTFDPRYMFDWYENGVLVYSQKRAKIETNIISVPANTAAASLAKDTSDWDRQAMLIKEVLQGVR
ncbi:SprT-like protease [Arthrobacter phage Mimi]|nr:SprT-like protease [Arthrobacter phage Mimi]